MTREELLALPYSDGVALTINGDEFYDFDAYWTFCSTKPRDIGMHHRITVHFGDIVKVWGTVAVDEANGESLSSHEYQLPLAQLPAALLAMRG